MMASVPLASAPTRRQLIDPQYIARVHDGVVLPFLKMVKPERLETMTADERIAWFATGAPGSRHLSDFLTALDPGNASTAFNFVIGKAPFAPLVVPMFDHVRSLVPEGGLRSMGTLGLGSLISEWEVGIRATKNDSVLIAEMLHAISGKMPTTVAMSIARVAGHQKRKGEASGMSSALDWLVDRCAVNPSMADSERNVWHEAIVLAMALTRRGTIHSDFQVFDEMPMEFIERMSARHAPSDPLTEDNQSPARHLLPPDTQIKNGDLVGVLQEYCGSTAGLRKALALEHDTRMRRGTTAARSPGALLARL